MTLARELALEALNELQARSADAVRLARVASVAIRIEPHLLRRLRVELVPNADVGAEGDLWFSELVESSGSGAIVLRPEAARILREHLAREPALLVRARAVLLEAHRAAPSTLQLEEEINGLALLRDQGYVEAIDRALRPALTTLLRGETDRALEIARWTLRAAPSFDPAVWESGNAHALLLAASTILRERRFAKPPSTGAPALNTFTWALPPTLLNQRVTVGVELLERAVRFLDAPHEATIEVPATNPPLVELSYTLDGSERLTLAEALPGTVVALEGDVDSLVLRTSAGDEYRLEAITSEARAAGGSTAGNPLRRSVSWQPGRAKILEPAWMDEACVEIETLGSQGSPATAFYISPSRLVTAASPFRGIPYLATPHGQMKVLNADDESSAVLLLEPVARSGPADALGLSLNVTRRASTNELIVPSTARVIAVVEGETIAIEVDVRGSLMQAGEARFEAYAEERELPRAFLGAPIVVGDTVAGVVTGLEPGFIGGRTRLVATGSVVIVGLERLLREGTAPSDADGAEADGSNVPSTEDQTATAAPPGTPPPSASAAEPVREAVSPAVNRKPAEQRAGLLTRLNRWLNRRAPADASKEPAGGVDSASGSSRAGGDASRQTAQIFISYTATDRDVAKSIGQLLEQQGLRCWIAARDIPRGARYDDATAAAIRTSALMIAVVSNDANESENVREEIEAARSSNVPVLPVLADGSPPEGTLRFLLRDTQWFDMSAGTPDDRARLIQVVRQLVEKGGSLTSR